MTTETSIPCPECGQYWPLLAGLFPEHTPGGIKCPMSDHAPTDWPPAGEHPLDTKAPAEAVAGLEQASPAGGAPDKKRKRRSDAGTKRQPKVPKAKRRPPEHIVMQGDYTVFTEANGGLDAARTAMGTARALWELASEHERGDVPILVTGRVRATEYVPERVIPATVRVKP